MIGARSIGPWRDEDAADLLLVLVADATTPEPAVAVPVEVPPAFWEPAPVRPGPFPAPVLNKAAAPDGIAGRELLVTFQLDE